MRETGSTFMYPIRKFAAALLVLLLAAVVIWPITKQERLTPAEPVYVGRTLHEWIRAEPPGNTSHEDIMNYRREALLAMGEPASRYLQWMIAHPRQTLNGHTTWIDRLGRHLPKRWQNLFEPPANRADFSSVILALQLIDSKPRAAALNLVRLWESEGNPDYASYNGFPITLAVIGNASPGILSALHRHFSSPNRLHRALCAFGAWRLNPNDTEAVAILRRELTSRDTTELHARYALLTTFSRFGTNAEPFLPEIRALVADSTTVASVYQTIAAEAAGRILNEAEPANAK